MKIIRPEQPEKVETKLFIDNKEVKPFKVEKVEVDYIDDKTNPIEYIMNEVINENTNKITFSITLTKRQYDLFNKKGGVSWLKKVLVGQQNSPHGRGKKKKK